jgi:pimeloyl-ACP methyl ester carboxylesterase
MPDFLSAGYWVLRFDNRGIGKSARPRGPYTTALMASDAKALVDRLGVKNFHLVGVSIGGMISQEYALAYGADLKSLSLCCTYAAPGPFCSRMFKLWQDMAPVMGVPTVMRDVTLWAFTQDMFLNQQPTLKEFEAANGHAGSAGRGVPRAAQCHPGPRHPEPTRFDQDTDARSRRGGRHPDPDEPGEGAAQPGPGRPVCDRQRRTFIPLGISGLAVLTFVGAHRG